MSSRLCDTEGVQDRAQIVRHNSVADPVGTNSNDQTNRKSMDVAAAFNQVTVLGLIICTFLFQSLANLTIFVLNKRIVVFAIRVILD